jgi:hypothetical protein
MHHMKHMVGCLLMIGAIVAIWIVGAPGWLAGLVLLACPIMMVWMVVMMSGDHNKSATGGSATSDHAHR